MREGVVTMLIHQLYNTFFYEKKAFLKCISTTRRLQRFFERPRARKRRSEAKGYLPPVLP